MTIADRQIPKLTKRIEKRFFFHKLQLFFGRVLIGPIRYRRDVTLRKPVNVQSSDLIIFNFGYFDFGLDVINYSTLVFVNLTPNYAKLIINRLFHKV